MRTINSFDKDEILKLIHNNMDHQDLIDATKMNLRVISDEVQRQQHLEVIIEILRLIDRRIEKIEKFLNLPN